MFHSGGIVPHSSPLETLFYNVQPPKTSSAPQLCYFLISSSSLPPIEPLPTNKQSYAEVEYSMILQFFRLYVIDPKSNLLYNL